MQNIDLICVGKLNAKYFAEGVAEYQKRLAAFANFRIIELPEEKIDPENDGNRGRADGKRRERGEDHRRQLLPQDLRTEPDSRKSAAWQYTDSGWKMYFQCGSGQ